MRAHTVKITQDWQKANMENHWSQEIRPPSSPGCNLLDYFMWSVVAREVSKHPHNTLTSLRAKISEIMIEMDREAVILLCQRFWSQIEAVVEASGDFIE